VPIVTRTRRIDAPREDVWAVLADVPAQPRWMHDLKEIRDLTPGPIGVGTRAVGVVRMFGVAQADPVEVTVFEPPHRFAIRHEGTFKGSGAFRLDAIDAGARTRVRWREELVPDPDALRVPRLLRPILPIADRLAWPVFALVFRNDLRRLARLAERRAAGESGSTRSAGGTASGRSTSWTRGGR
jgi:uncharacterized protein YndB with AHSA1/START domain